MRGHSAPRADLVVRQTRPRSRHARRPGSATRRLIEGSRYGDDKIGRVPRLGLERCRRHVWVGGFGSRARNRRLVRRQRSRRSLGDSRCRGCLFLESEAVPFDQLGIGVRVLWPGRSTWLYHSESAQEDFLVLSGESLLLVEEQERSLRAWDFVHCPPGTAHAFVAVGDRPCAIVMVGARPVGHTFNYPRSELALRHGVSVEADTTSPAEALASFREWMPLHRNDRGSLPWSDDT